MAKKLEAIESISLWRGCGNEFKYHLVNWVAVYKPKDMGGLGVRYFLVLSSKQSFVREMVVENWDGRGGSLAQSDWVEVRGGGKGLVFKGASWSL